MFFLKYSKDKNTVNMLSYCYSLRGKSSFLDPNLKFDPLLQFIKNIRVENIYFRL